MKKQLLYSFAAMASLALASCNGDYDDWAAPQTNEEQSSTEKYSAMVNVGPDNGIQLPTDKDTLRLQSFSSNNPDVVGFSVRKLLIEKQEIKAFVSNNDLCVLTSDFTNLVRDAFLSRAHKTYNVSLDVDYAANLANGDAVALPSFEVLFQVTTPKTPEVDPKGYYLLGQWQGWNLATPTWMTDNGDGTFSATVTTGDGDNWFKFYQGSHYSSTDWEEVNKGQMGCAVNGDNSLFNYVVWNNDPDFGDVQTPVISGSGTYEIILDVVNYTYTVRRAEARYYVVGTPQGWSGDDMRCMFYAQGGNIYSYTTSWTGAWDLKVWDAAGFGDWSKTFGGINGDGSETGNLIPGGDGAFQSPSAGYYTLTINMNDNSYKWETVTPSTDYTNVSLIGDFNGWGGDIDLEQIATAPHNWYVRATIESSGGLKFRANHDWAISWGTSDSDTAIGETYYLPIGEGNINVPAGTYDFYLNDITGRWNIVPVE
ncbi:MAG: DUF5115 domain-containing protein [Prevotella sp.]